MIKYSFVRVNLEAFKMDSAQDRDVIYDGYNSEFNRIMLKLQLKTYNLNNGLPPTEYDNTKADTKIENDVVNVYAYQTYDECISINP